MKKTSKFKSKKYPRLKKYLYGDTVDGGLTPMTVPEDPSLRPYSAPAESAAVTQQKQQQAQLDANAQAKKEKNAANASTAVNVGSAAVTGGIGMYNAFSNPNSTMAQKQAATNATTDAVVSAVAGPISGTITKVAHQIADPIKADLEKTDSSGNLVNESGARTGAIIGSFLDPVQAISTRGSYDGGWTDFSGKGYTAELEKEAKDRIASEKAYNDQIAAQEKQKQDQINQQIESGIKSGIQSYYENPDNNKNQSQTFAKYGGQMPSQTFAMGGIPEMPNGEVEGNEMITSNTRPQTFGAGGVELASNNPYGTPTWKTDGPAHSNGGMPISMAPGSVINGKTINPMTGNKFTKDIDAIAKMENKFTKKAESGDKYSRTMAKLMLPTLAMKKEKLNELQKYVIANNEERKALKNGVIPSRDNEMSEPQGMPDQSQNGMVMARYGAQMKYRMGGMQRLPMYDDGGPLLSPEGYNSINQFENTVGTYDKNTGLPVSMNAGDQYAQTGGSSNAVKEIEDYIDSSIGRDAWDKLPDNIKTQMYDSMFNSGGANKDYYMRGLAQAIYNSDPNSKNYGMTGKDQRNALDLNESFNTIKNASYSNDDIYNNFVGIRGEQLNSIGKNSKFPDAYMPTYSSRAKSIDANYINNSAANKPVTPGVPVNPSAPQTATQQPAYNNIYPRMSPSPFITKQEQNQLSWEDMNRRGQANELAATGQQPQAATPPVAQTPSYNNIYPRVSTTPSPFITPRESDRLQYENDVRKVTEQGMAAKKAGKKPPPDPKDYSNYKDYAREAAIFAGQNLGNISDLIRTRGGRKYDKESYGQMTPQMPDFTEAKRNAKSEASAYRRMLPGLTGGNAGATLGMMGQLQGLSQQALAKIVEGEQQARTGVYNQFLPLNKQLQMQERADTQANKARSEDIARMATSGIADTIGGAGLDYGMYKNQKEQFALIKNAYPDYDYNERKKAWYHKDTKEKLDPTKVQAATKATK